MLRNMFYIKVATRKVCYLHEAAFSHIAPLDTLKERPSRGGAWRLPHTWRVARLGCLAQAAATAQAWEEKAGDGCHRGIVSAKHFPCSSRRLNSSRATLTKWLSAKRQNDEN